MIKVRFLVELIQKYFFFNWVHFIIEYFFVELILS